MALALLVLLGVAGGVTIPYFYRPLPDPAVADRDDLFRWLVVRDLRLESAETRRVLAIRLGEEFQSGLDWEATAEQLDQSQRQQVWDNIVLLLRPWFMDKQQTYFELTAAERPAYLDQILDTMAVWRGIDSLYPAAEAGQTGGDPPAGKDRLLGVLLQRIELWKQEADPQQQQRTSQFHHAIQLRWLVRKMKRLLPASG